MDVHEGSGGRYGAVIRELNVKMGDFEACDFMYESRRRDYEADSLAKFPISLDLGRHVWLVELHDVVTIPIHIYQ